MSVFQTFYVWAQMVLRRRGLHFFYEFDLKS
jgi:hypothetical protein